MASEDPATDAFAEIADGLLSRPEVEQGTGFGTRPGLKVGGKIFAMLVKGRLVVKLPADRVAELTESAGAENLAMGERRMREWVSVPVDQSHSWSKLAAEALRFVREAE